MDYLVLALALLSTIHSFSYAVWLKQGGNKIGAAVVVFIAAAGVGLPVYRIFTNF